MKNPSPKPIGTHIPPQLNQHKQQVDMLPFFESSYLGEHQPPMASHEVSAVMDRPWNFYTPWENPAETKYVTEIRPNDVLNGRGGATNSYVGNRSFRKLVKQYKGDYLKAKKRDKPKVAKLVVEKIRETGGRFLERYKTNNGVLWVDIGDERAKEKASQALREGAPEIRRRKALSDVDSGGKNHKDKDSDGSLSATSAFDRAESDEDNKFSSSGKTQILRTNFESEKNEAVSIAVAPMVIRPSITLLCGGQLNKPLAIPIDNLDEREREIYLRDFLPPNPSIQKKKLDLQTFAVVSATDSENGRKEKDEGWGTYNKVIEL